MDPWEPMLRVLMLATAANTLWPAELPMPQAIRHASLAVEYGDAHDVQPETILAIARCETRFIPEYVSRKDGRDGKRYTGIWKSRERAPYFVAPYFCGVMQAKSNTWYGCVYLRGLWNGYEKGTMEIEQWLADNRCRGDEGCALAGHGNGNAGVERWQNPQGSVARAHRRWLKETRTRTSNDPGWCDRTLPYYERVLQQRDRLRAIVDDLSLPKPVAPSLGFE